MPRISASPGRKARRSNGPSAAAPARDGWRGTSSPNSPGGRDWRSALRDSLRLRLWLPQDERQIGNPKTARPEERAIGPSVSKDRALVLLEHARGVAA